MMTFNLWTATRQISAAQNPHEYLILLVPFWKMMSFETKWISFSGVKAMHFADETLSFKDSVIQATQ